MSHGYTGKILRADLSSGKMRTEEFPESFYRQYFGGAGFIGYFLLKEVAKGVDPLSPDNKVIFAAGPVAGVPVGGSGRHAVGGKSPLTGGYGEADSGGYWGAELKMAGFDAIIVEGKAEKPIYLFVQDGKAELKDARHLWGMKALECQNAIRDELGDQQIKVALIGPAGENLVRFACVMNDLDAAAGRTGMGAVMGSKNLKAIACRGHQPVSLADKKAVHDIGRWIVEKTATTLKGWREYGTAGVLDGLNGLGGLPTRNFQVGHIDGADRINGQALRDTIFVKNRSCFACPVHCKREVEVKEPYVVDPRYGGPEYETLASLGSDCGITDLPVIAKGNELVNAYGLDSISCGAAIAFAMECFENGLLKASDTGGMDLHFGNTESMLKLIELIAQREGIGDMLAEGVARAAKKIGPAAGEFALNVKGQELPMHDPRLKHALGIGYIMSPTGADHCHNLHDTAYASATPSFEVMRTLGAIEPLPITDLSAAKMQMLIYSTIWRHFLNCATSCFFVIDLGFLGFDKYAQLVSAVTGWDTTVFELMKVGERACNLARVFNLREGFSVQDDKMPQRFFTSQASGPLQGVKLDPVSFQQAQQAYYDIMSWPNGVPSKGKLGELGIDWAAALI